MKNVKTIAATGITAFLTTAASAHPGHDHSATPGGEAHMLLWAVIGAAAVIALTYAVRRGVTNAQQAEERVK